jgi:hypothetical protein
MKASSVVILMLVILEQTMARNLGRTGPSGERQFRAIPSASSAVEPPFGLHAWRCMVGRPQRVAMTVFA